MAFSAAGAVIELAWDLRPHVDAHGIVPEPSQAKLDAYADALAGVFAELGLDLKASATQDELDEAMQAHIDRELEGVAMGDARKKIEERFHAPIRARRIKASVAVCGGKPSAAQIAGLPPRLRDAYLDWVRKWALDPTEAGLSV